MYMYMYMYLTHCPPCLQHFISMYTGSYNNIIMMEDITVSGAVGGERSKPPCLYCISINLLTYNVHVHSHFHVCSTVRVWRGPKQCDVLTAHKPAVWAIASLFEFDGTRRILSGIGWSFGRVGGGALLH